MFPQNYESEQEKAVVFISNPQRPFSLEVDRSTLQPVGQNWGASQRSAGTHLSPGLCSL